MTIIIKLYLIVLITTTRSLCEPKNGRVIGGGDAKRGDFPYMVSLQYCSPNCSHTCGGSIISPSWILSAAHCITKRSDPAKNYKVVAGILNLTDTNIERQEVRVTKTLVHPDYAGGVGPHDIGLFKLATILEYTEQVKSIVLPIQDEVFDGNVTLIGWGGYVLILGVLPYPPDTLQTVDVPIISFEECNKAMEELLQSYDHALNEKGNICTGSTTERISSCSGDSGGPLVQNGVVVGIDSWGVTPCGTEGAPSVFVKTSHYVDWIKKNVDDDLIYN